MTKIEERKFKDRQRHKIFRETHPEIVRERNRSYRKKHPDKDRQWSARWRMKNKQKSLERNRRITRLHAGVHNPTGDRPHGPCEICKKVCLLVLDHNHETGKARGWLCYNCNMRLVSALEHPLIDIARSYLRKYLAPQAGSMEVIEK